MKTIRNRLKKLERQPASVWEEPIRVIHIMGTRDDGSQWEMERQEWNEQTGMFETIFQDYEDEDE